MLNEFDNVQDRTSNFNDHRMKMQDFSITSIIKAYDYINTLAQFIPQENEVLDNLETIIEPLADIIKKLMTDELCSHCNSNLFKSDLPQYDYVCPECDENF